MNLGKKDIIAAIKHKTGWTHPQAFLMLHLVLDEMHKALSRGDNIRLNDFGYFRIYREPGRRGYDFINKKPMPKPVTVANVRFKMSGTLYRNVRGLLPKTSPNGGHSGK